ncbi:MAG TPA: TlpA disulfide reductase family protein [Candidatus Omnitrophota bacterium]|nr:TlpA disulfide reductase family protein [Candidatus Omnitrophota bacterium]
MMTFKQTTGLIICSAMLFAAPAQAQFFVFENPLVGKQAPDFTASTLNSGKISMSQFRDGQSAIIFFWATWCPHCRKQLKELAEKKQELTQKGIKIILVDIQENAQQVKGYMDKNRIDYEVFLDEDQSIAENFGIVGVPTFFFLNKDGVIKAVEHEIPSDYEKILAQK